MCGKAPKINCPFDLIWGNTPMCSMARSAPRHQVLYFFLEWGVRAKGCADLYNSSAYIRQLSWDSQDEIIIMILLG